MVATAQDRHPLDVKFEPATSMPPKRKADADAVTEAIAVALIKDDEPTG